jgi:hypothetical protein
MAQKKNGKKNPPKKTSAEKTPPESQETASSIPPVKASEKKDPPIPAETPATVPETSRRKLSYGEKIGIVIGIVGLIWAIFVYIVPDKKDLSRIILSTDQAQAALEQRKDQIQEELKRVAGEETAKRRVL